MNQGAGLAASGCQKQTETTGLLNIFRMNQELGMNK